MHAPLARHLVRFPRPPAGATAVPPVLEMVPAASEPTVTMTVAAFEARLDVEREALRASLEAEHSIARGLADTAHAEALATAVADGAARRDVEEGTAFAVQIAGATQAVRDGIAEQLAKTLRPLMAEAVAARAVGALVDIVARALADPDHPALTIRGPARLLSAVEGALSSGGITFEATEASELSVTANGIHIETRAAAALAALDATEGA